MPALAEYADSAHALGMHLKMYYTLGQITNHMTELFALKTLRGEVLLRNVSAVPPTAVAANSSIGHRRQLGMGNGLVPPPRHKYGYRDPGLTENYLRF
jgi:hypothetical protein|eukprot:COSAG01_NODE_391_length_17672_cov_4.507369_12_plen_98_part_00